MIAQARVVFETAFGEQPDVIVRAPGRVNLIGEHTDYNEGFVFPVAIDRWVVFAMRPRPDGLARIFSVLHQEMVEFSMQIPPERTGHWSDYPKGVVREFQALGHVLRGFDAVLLGNVPMGAGLSSSAAVEMAVGKGLLELNGFAMPGPELALLGQRAENRFVGVNCGIMDQFISANAREGHALFLDCRDLSYEQVPLAGANLRIVICNSAVTRRLTASAYNERRAACEEGVKYLCAATHKSFLALRDVTLDVLEACRDELPEEIFRRCLHVVGENDRTQRAVTMLKKGDVAGFGQLMAASHVSLRDDYEVSGKELDVLVEIAQRVPGVLGARMTGAGFGGCTVNLVEEGAAGALTDAVKDQYVKETGLTPEVYVCTAVNGAEVVSGEGGEG